MKKFLLTLAMVATAALVAGGAMAADKDQPVKKDKPAKVEKLDGKKLYREMCKVCHGPKAEAGEYSPMFLIQEQWTQFFEEDYAEIHKDLTYDDEAKTKVEEAITPAMLKAIYDFCIKGAADSEHPMTCG